MVGAGNNRLFDDLCQVHVVRPFILLSCVRSAIEPFLSLACFHAHLLVSRLACLFPRSLVHFYARLLVSTLACLFPRSLACFHARLLVSTLARLFPCSVACFHARLFVSTLARLFPRSKIETSLYHGSSLHGVCMAVCSQKMTLPEVSKDARFVTNDLRVKNRKELISILAKRCCLVSLWSVDARVRRSSL